MITLTTEQAQQIEEALVATLKNNDYWLEKCTGALDTIRAARAQGQAEQEPVAYTNKEQVNELIKESARLIGSIKDEGDQYLTAMNKLEQAAQQALEALEVSTDWDMSATGKQLQSMKAITALRKALAEQDKQEPVAVISESAIGLVKLHSNGACLPFGTQLYAAPVQPVKQEPVAKVTVRSFNPMDASCPTTEVRWLKEPVSGLLYAAPVSAEAIRAEAYQKGRDDMKEEAAKEAWNLAPTDESAGEIAAAIRGLK